MQRSLETAHIYADEIVGDEAFNSIAREILSYESYVSPPPYDHIAIYNTNLPENFEDLSDEEKVEAAKKAQAATINHLFSLKTSEAEQYNKEVAGSFAVFIDKYIRMTRRLKSGSRVLIPAGTHGGTMEHLLFQALVTKDEEGLEKIGLDSIDDIGGGFDPSEAYDVSIETDENGELKALNVTFDDPKRPKGEMKLDLGKIEELKDFYKNLHSKDTIAPTD